MSLRQWRPGRWGSYEAMEPYDVTCARCGKVLPCTEAVVEEADEWECVPCNDRCNAQERTDSGATEGKAKVEHGT